MDEPSAPAGFSPAAHPGTPAPAAAAASDGELPQTWQARTWWEQQRRRAVAERYPYRMRPHEAMPTDMATAPALALLALLDTGHDGRLGPLELLDPPLCAGPAATAERLLRELLDAGAVAVHPDTHPDAFGWSDHFDAAWTRSGAGGLAAPHMASGIDLSQLTVYVPWGVDAHDAAERLGRYLRRRFDPDAMPAQRYHELLELSAEAMVDETLGYYSLWLQKAAGIGLPEQVQADASLRALLHDASGRADLGHMCALAWRAAQDAAALSAATSDTLAAALHHQIDKHVGRMRSVEPFAPQPHRPVRAMTATVFAQLNDDPFASRLALLRRSGGRDVAGTDQDRAAELAARLVDEHDCREGERDRAAQRIAALLAEGVPDYTIINAAKSVRDKTSPIRLFLEVTSTTERTLTAAQAGAAIYPAPGVAPPSVPEEEREPSQPTMCAVHLQRLYEARDGTRRCRVCEMGG